MVNSNMKKVSSGLTYGYFYAYFYGYFYGGDWRACTCGTTTSCGTTSAYGIAATYAKIKPKQQRLGLILNGDPDWIRTNDTKFRKLVLYPLSYEAIYMYCIMLTCTARLTQRACLQLFLKRALKPIHKRRLICVLMLNVICIFIKQLIHLF